MHESAGLRGADKRACLAVMGGVHRRQSRWGWVVGWVLVDVRTKKEVGELARRPHADGHVPYLCASPTTGWRGVRLRR